MKQQMDWPLVPFAASCTSAIKDLLPNATLMVDQSGPLESILSDNAHGGFSSIVANNCRHQVSILKSLRLSGQRPLHCLSSNGGSNELLLLLLTSYLCTSHPNRSIRVRCAYLVR